MHFQGDTHLHAQRHANVVIIIKMATNEEPTATPSTSPSISHWAP